jgi:hypothetical protein
MMLVIVCDLPVPEAPESPEVASSPGFQDCRGLATVSILDEMRLTGCQDRIDIHPILKGRRLIAKPPPSKRPSTG